MHGEVTAAEQDVVYELNAVLSHYMLNENVTPHLLYVEEKSQ